ncbi:hypothetical protein DXG03_007798 [Asterophora parasitica]|uniref:RED-like N-terminal domain-containing protein n=1 Tax=Asterophora parasitica TaxID=117018 RepID=A0A9P7GCB0_9AGAR|nr:hypothetical protein DXG03_007798 [Asterophora parasitica]
MDQAISVIDASQPAFKPRKVKKGGEEKYRDRAAERRVGEGNDYAQVEAVLEDFEKRHAGEDKAVLEDFEKRHAGEDKAVIDAQRHYLGGDASHTVLVKGLDMALLEQNRTRVAGLATEDDDSLEQAFLEAAPQSKKKRTRADLIRELKANRGNGNGGDVEKEDGEAKNKAKEDEALLLERAKQAGKFKPIGFKPIGAAPTAEKGKKKKKKEGETDGERKKKKRKVEAVVEGTKEEGTTSAPPPAPPPPIPASKPKPAELVPEPLGDDFDIFADAGEYEGLALDSDDSDHETKDKDKDKLERRPQDAPFSPPATAPRRWIDTGSPEPEPTKPELLASALKSTSASGPPWKEDGEASENEQDEEGEVAPMRLVPLASSALPSIKDFLAMEEAASGGGKKGRKRKGGGSSSEKKGAEEGEEGKKRAAEAKADRDYKRLKNYTDKKAAAS